MSNACTISIDEVAAIEGGYHNNVFAVLGPHFVNGQLVIRAFTPGVIELSIQFEGSESWQSPTFVGEQGFFEWHTDRTDHTAYQFHGTTQVGDTIHRADPYAFSDVRREGAIYERCGAHLMTINGISGTYFAVWAPNAERVSVVGEFNQWDGRQHVMRRRHEDGVWDIFVPGLGKGTLYKYEIKTHYKGYMTKKADPIAFYSELRPDTASIVWEIDSYEWHDQDWMTQGRAKAHQNGQPVSIYEVHLGSWKRAGTDGSDWLTYEDLADQLVNYVVEMGYTHIELLPVSEHPFDGSWGYQVTGYYAPTSRFGPPESFMNFVDKCHQAGIGVILDWVPAHFPKDEHGLGFFDGTYLYEHADPRQGEHPDWGTKIFNFGRNEVRDFLIDNALFWLEKYHIDGLRVDAVASMLYLDFSRDPGQWIPNRYGGRENIEAIEFIRKMNRDVHDAFPDVLTIAEESTAWPGVTRDVDDNGLGFNVKWNMGWMNDTLRYFSTDPLYRSYHQGTLTFSLLYAFSERYTLVFSHDEVVHLKRSMVDKMPGDLWQKFANLRLLYAYQYAHPGRKLNFMGNEIAQWREWSEDRSLDWHLLEEGSFHAGVQLLIKDLNHLYRDLPAIHRGDDDWQGFRWIDFRDAQHSILAFLRADPDNPDDQIIVICNFTPKVHHDYRIGVPAPGKYREIFNSDHMRYQGSGVINGAYIETVPLTWQDQPHSVQVSLPPLAAVYLQAV